MALQLKTPSLKEFLVSYPAGLKKDAPVVTGTLRDSIAVLAPTLASIFDIITVAVDYAYGVNLKHKFVEKNDFRIEDFATGWSEDLWDDFYEENKEPNK